MKTLFIRLLLIIAFLPFISCQNNLDRGLEPDSVNDISEFFGHWSFDIEGGGVGWLDIRQEDDYLDADLLWKGGSVLPVAHVYLANDGVLHITRTFLQRRMNPKDGDIPRVHTVTSWIEARIDRQKIYGHLLVPKVNGIGVDSTWIEGIKLPEIKAAPNLTAIKFSESIELFNGVDLTGWELIEVNFFNGFKVIDGILINDAQQVLGEPRIRYGNLRTVDEFEDFNLILEVNVPPNSNSGIYLRGMYEVQVVDSYGREPNSHNLGALYSRIAPEIAVEKPAGEWQTLNITLADRHVTVILNGIKIIDNQPVYGPTGGAIKSDVFAPGPIVLQGDHGAVSYRNIVITPIVY